MTINFVHPEDMKRYSSVYNTNLAALASSEENETIHSGAWRHHRQ